MTVLHYLIEKRTVYSKVYKMLEARIQFQKDELIAAIIDRIVDPAKPNPNWEKFAEGRTPDYRQLLTLISGRLAAIFERVFRYKFELEALSDDRANQAELKDAYSELWGIFKDWIRNNKGEGARAYIEQSINKGLSASGVSAEAKKKQLIRAILDQINISSFPDDSDPAAHTIDEDPTIVIQQNSKPVLAICKIFANTVNAAIAIRLDKDTYYEGTDRPHLWMETLIEKLGKKYADCCNQKHGASYRLVYDELGKILSFSGQPASQQEKPGPAKPPATNEKNVDVPPTGSAPSGGPPAVKTQSNSPVPSKKPTSSGNDSSQPQRSGHSPGPVVQSQTGPAATPLPPQVQGPVKKDVEHVAKKSEPPKPAPPPPPPPQWKNLPIEGDIDKHEEAHCKPGTSPEGLKLIGARVRGKKHKHEATNCDDWFEFAVSGAWTIIAVADGAGSKKFSRVGAKIACEVAVKQLARDLKDKIIAERDSWTTGTFNRHEVDLTFAENDLEVVQAALLNAVLAARATFVEEAERRSDSMRYFKLLGHEFQVDDLAATLLLAIHSTVKYKNENRSFVLTCQIGDGLIGALPPVLDAAPINLSSPDSGKFSGETDFLTSPKWQQRENLARKTSVFFGPIRALMIMTDGVADDYFPLDPGMNKLYADLVLNQILNLAKPEEVFINKVLSPTKLHSLETLLKAKLYSIAEMATSKGTVPIRWRSVLHYAQQLGVPEERVWKVPELLYAGAQGEPLCDEDLKPEEKLLRWLDSYQVKGSFDDRTLVVLYRDEAS